MKKRLLLPLILVLCLWGCAAPTAQEETAAQETTAAQENSVAEFNRIMEGMENLSSYHVANRSTLSGQGETLGANSWTEIWADGEDYLYLTHMELPDVPAYDYGYLYLDGVLYGYNIVESEDDPADTWRVLDETFSFVPWAKTFCQSELTTQLVDSVREGDKQTITVLRGEEQTLNGVLYSPMTLTVTLEGERVASLTLSYHMIPEEEDPEIPENWIYQENTTEFYDDDAQAIRTVIDSQLE